MALFELALVGGAAYAGIQTYRQRGKKGALLAILSTKTAEQIAHIQTALTQLDVHYQSFMQTKIDPLLGGETRQQQMDLLASEPKLQINDILTNTDDAEINRYLGLSVALMGVATLSTLLEASITAERELAERATARDRAKAEVERRASDSMQLIDAEIVALRPSLKVPEARAEAARRLKSLIADREAARAAVTRLARAEASTPKAWKQYEVKVEALDGPADLREKADFVEDTRDTLR